MEWQAKVRYVDVRVITITADTEEEAREKFRLGDFDDETTVDFYSDELLEELTQVDATP